MDVTSRFVLDFVRRYEQAGSSLPHKAGSRLPHKAGSNLPHRILDFGCGAGRLVAEGRAEGLDIWGADVYYGGSSTRREAEAAGLLGTARVEKV